MPSKNQRSVPITYVNSSVRRAYTLFTEHPYLKIIVLDAFETVFKKQNAVFETKARKYFEQCSVAGDVADPIVKFVVNNRSNIWILQVEKSMEYLIESYGDESAEAKIVNKSIRSESVKNLHDIAKMEADFVVTSSLFDCLRKFNQYFKPEYEVSIAPIIMGVINETDAESRIAEILTNFVTENVVNDFYFISHRTLELFQQVLGSLTDECSKDILEQWKSDLEDKSMSRLMLILSFQVDSLCSKSYYEFAKCNIMC